MIKKIAIIYNPPRTQETADNLDTLTQLQEITSILKTNKITVTQIPFFESLEKIEKTLLLNAPDIVFNLVESLKGTDALAYTATAFLEYMGYQYTGCPAWSLAALSNKIVAKNILTKAQLPTPDFFTLDSKLPLNSSDKWIVKSATENASFEMNKQSINNTIGQALLSLKNKNSGNLWFAEKFISGREFNVSIIEDLNGKAKVLTPAEMTLQNNIPLEGEIIDYEAKWCETSSRYNKFFRRFEYTSSDKDLLINIRDISAECWELFGLRGAARVDFRIDETGHPWILEVNANPCLSSDAGLAAAALFEGISHNELILNIIKMAEKND